MINHILIAETRRHLPPEANNADTLVLTVKDWRRKLHDAEIARGATAVIYATTGPWHELALKEIQRLKALA